MTNKFKVAASLLLAGVIVTGFAAVSSAAVCAGGGTFACSTCASTDVTGTLGASSRYSWFDFSNRAANQGGNDFADFACGGGLGDVCWFNPGAATTWTIAAGDWGNAVNCSAPSTVANTAVIINNNTVTGGQVAFMVAADNPSPSAATDSAPNTGTSVVTSIARPAIAGGGVVAGGLVAGGTCGVPPCMDVTMTIPDLAAAAYAKGGGVIANSNRGWAIYERKSAPGAEGTRDGTWVMSGLAAGGAATKNIAGGLSYTIRTSSLTTWFALAPVLGGTGTGCRAASTASNSSDAACAAAESLYLGQSLQVIPTGAGDVITGTANYESLKSVNVTWQTASEMNTAGFNISRSLNQTNWTKVNETLVPATGVAGGGASYSFTDDVPRQRTYTKFYYRIDQLDTNGNVQATLNVTVSR